MTHPNDEASAGKRAANLSLNYALQTTVGPKRRAAAAHLLVWGIINQIVGYGILGIALMLLVVSMGIFGPQMLFFGFAPGFLGLVMVACGRSCMRIRRQMVAGDRRALPEALSLCFIALVLAGVATALFGIIALAIAGSMERCATVGFIGCMFAVLEGLLIWTHVVLLGAQQTMPP